VRDVVLSGQSAALNDAFEPTAACIPHEIVEPLVTSIKQNLASVREIFCRCA
jgi:hypothetical protein